MNPEPMNLHGRALLDYYHGDRTAGIILRRDDGFEATLPVSVFFRSEAEFLPGEIEAINLSRGHVLDIGAGSGIHSLVLQSRGLQVTAIDIDPNAVSIMIDRGVKDARCADIMKFEDGLFDTLLMLGHGIGITGDIHGFNSFLDHASGFIAGNGQLLINSVDVRQTDEQLHLKYHRSNKQAGRYIGEVRLQFEFKGEKGPFFGWLHIDSQTLQELAAIRKWRTEIIYQSEDGEYLARLTCKRSV